MITANARELDERSLFYYLTGKKVDVLESAHKAKPEEENVILRLENFSSDTFVKGVNLGIRQGEVFVIFGLIGSGRSTLARGLFGLSKTEGKIFLDGQEVRPRSPKEAIKLGFGYLPEDRRFALVYELPVFANITLAILSLLSRRGILDLRTEREIAEEYVNTLQIKTPDLTREVLYLSGGNQQKVLLARWLARKPKVLIMDEPTRGIDVGAKFEIRSMVRRLVSEGFTVLYITSEPVEALEVADRIAVMRDGRIVKVFDEIEGLDKTTLLAFASGVN